MCRHLAATLLSCSVLAPFAFGQGAEPLFVLEGAEYLGPDLQFQRVMDLDHDGRDEVLGAFWAALPARDQMRFGAVDFDPGEEYRPWTMETPVVAHSCSSDGPMAGTAVGDFDGDGFQDFAVIVRNRAFVYATRPGGPPVLLDEIEWSMNDWHLEFLGADLNGDGVDDFVAAGEEMQMWVNDGAGAFTSLAGPRSMVGSVVGKVTIAAVDMDGDGAEEIAYRDPRTYWTARRIIVVEPGPTGDITVVQVLDNTLRYAFGMVVGDIDGDQDRDIVLFDEDADEYEVFRRTGLGTFVLEPVRSGGPASHFLDLDGDGDLDGLCCGGGSANTCNTDPHAASTYRICLNDGTGNFDVSIARPGVTTGFDGLAGLLDFDGDGDLDPIAGRTVLVNHSQVGAAYCPNTPNSTGVSGKLRASGTGSLRRGDLVLHGSDLPGHQTVLLLLAGRRGAVPLGNGTLCLEAPIMRYRLATIDAQGEVLFPLPAGDFPSVYPGGLNVQATRRFQLWHRDVVAPGFALSDGLQVTFAP